MQIDVGQISPRRQCVSVLAVLASIWARPEPSILLLLHCFQEELADDVGLVAGLCCMLLLDNLLKLLLVPLVHVVILILPPTMHCYPCLARQCHRQVHWRVQYNVADKPTRAAKYGGSLLMLIFALTPFPSSAQSTCLCLPSSLRQQ